MNANAKLTKRLHITGRRADGYHLLDAEMVSLNLCDELSFADGDSLTIEGSAAASHHVVPEGDTNIVRRALRAVDRRCAVRLHKRIPAGGGLGGASADAAAVLRWAGCFDIAAALDLGADVPFCLIGGRARVTGIGENIEPLPYAAESFTLMTPPLAVSTPEAFAAWDELGGSSHESNDLEPAALRVVPELARWRDRFGEATGQQPMLAGSGSTWFVEGSFLDLHIDGALIFVTHTTPAVER